ncbi:hypothetical protein O9929_28275 [Vibrio lentus]|nr:hypothetical protein [Vibrio lentus]
MELDRLDVIIKKYQALAEQSLPRYNIDDLKDLINGNQYKRLPYLYQALWQVFDDVKNKQDNATLRSYLESPDPHHKIGNEFVDRKLKS